ncbi:MAG: SigB/SigF/SigG family RNA polymerase sigma factor [Christensenellales bacterium]
MLEHSETMELISLAKDGDQDAKSKLIEHNMPLIKSIVKRYKNKNVEYDDLIQLGALGLIKAINNFDRKFEVKFSTYAVPMIAGEIKRYIRDDGAIKVSRAIKTLNYKINDYISGYKLLNNREPSIDNIAKRFKISPQEVVFVMDSSRYPLSIYEQKDDENGTELLNKLPCGDNTDEQLNKMILKEAIEKLPTREKKIIFLRYFRDKTQSEIARSFGISQVQISRIETKIIEKLKKSFSEKV